MYEYTMAVYFWSLLAGVVVAVPFTALGIRVVAAALQGHDGPCKDEPPPSLTSLPSWPSSPV
jgi:hypothetical protein